MIAIQANEHGRPQGGGQSRRSPPLENPQKYFSLYGRPICHFFPMWEPFCYVFLLMGGPFYCLELFLVLFLHVTIFLLRFSSYGDPFHHAGGLLYLYCVLFWACHNPPPPTKISAGTHANEETLNMP